MVDGGWMGSDKCGIQVLHFQHFNCIVQYKQVDTNYKYTKKCRLHNVICGIPGQ